MEEAVWWCSLVAGNCLLQLDSRQKIHKVVFTKYVFTMEQFRDIAIKGVLRNHFYCWTVGSQGLSPFKYFLKKVKLCNFVF